MLSKVSPAAAPAAVPLGERCCLSTDHAAQYIGLGKTTIFALLKASEIEGVKIGQRRLVLRASCDAYIARQMKGAA
ncbi:MAG: excisionase family DNA-binding protein [Pseudomonadota bacterium]